VDIMDYSYYYKKKYNDIYETNSYNNIIVSKKNENFNIMYKNNTNFFIVPKFSFYNCKIKSKDTNNSKLNNIYSMIFYMDLTNNDHLELKDFINKLYNRLINCIEKQGLLILNEPINPIKYCNIFYANIYEKSKIINIENYENIELNALYNKSFTGYPIFGIPNLNIFNKKIYVNFNIYEFYIKFN
jgi:hypothetical protein